LLQAAEINATVITIAVNVRLVTIDMDQSLDECLMMGRAGKRDRLTPSQLQTLDIRCGSSAACPTVQPTTLPLNCVPAPQCRSL
jgi:hypothetical protein